MDKSFQKRGKRERRKEGEKMIERTLVLLKPDAVKRGLMGKIIQRFEDTALKVIGMKMVFVDREFAKKHYFDVEERRGKQVFERNATFLTSGPVVALCIEGIDAVKVVRKITGETFPNNSLPGTIRGDFGHFSKEYSDSKNIATPNLVHASSKKEEAEKEIGLWFEEKELHSYSTVYDVFL